MVTNLLRETTCQKQLHNPVPGENEHHVERLAAELGLKTKRLKDWVTRGWATASQRPFGRTWLIWADEQELYRLHQLAHHQSRPGGVPPSINLRTPSQNSREQ